MIKQLLEKSISDQVGREKEVALLLSGGVDSTSIGFAAHNCGLKITAYSFCLEGSPSYDSLAAEKTSKIMGWEFVLVELPRDTLFQDMQTMITRYGANKKTHIECGYPFIHVVPKIKENVVLCGVGVDTMFGMSKKACIHYKNDKEKFDEYRKKEFANFDNTSSKIIKNVFDGLGKTLLFPYRAKDLYEYFLAKSWNELNTPKQKFVVRDAFREQFAKIDKIKNHWNFQLCAGIDKEFEKQFLNNPEINFNKRNKMMFLYNDWVKKLYKSEETTLEEFI